MTPEHDRKLWQILSVACLLLVLDAWTAILRRPRTPCLTAPALL
jgi:hypothetical protein